MSIESDLKTRSSVRCELCSSASDLVVYNVKPNAGESSANSALVCETCRSQIEDPAAIDANHWRCLNGSMWSEFSAVQVLAYRQLKQMTTVSWAQDLLGQLYLDDEALAWAESGLPGKDDDQVKTVDSNGTELLAGDTVTLIKDLDVKGANFTAKRGTLVKCISLTGDPKFVEGRVNGTMIVLVAAYLKKA